MGACTLCRRLQHLSSRNLCSSVGDFQVATGGGFWVAIRAMEASDIQDMIKAYIRAARVWGEGLDTNEKRINQGVRLAYDIAWQIYYELQRLDASNNLFG